MQLYGNLTKIDTEQQIVAGYASTECIDRAGEIVLKSAIEDALDDYLEYGNIRQMHQLSAVGKAVDASVDDKGLYIEARIVDDDAWKKVTTGVYAGWSIGGKTLGRDPDNRNIITKIRLDEISLVDRPANPEAVIDLWRAAGLHDGGDLAKVVRQRDQLAKRLAHRDRALRDLADRVEKTLGKVSDIASENSNYRKQIAGLTKQLSEVRRPQVVVDNTVDRVEQMAVSLQKGIADTTAAQADIDRRLRRLEG